MGIKNTNALCVRTVVIMESCLSAYSKTDARTNAISDRKTGGLKHEGQESRKTIWREDDDIF
jgi:hypothetical protein